MRLFLFLILSMLLRSAAAQNPVVSENQLEGTDPSVWDIVEAGDLSIQGFATDISVDLGETVYFKIKTDATAYTIDIYRLGYYQGNGARMVSTDNPVVFDATLPQAQPADLFDPATGLTDCGNWAVSAHWNVPSTAVSGVYIAKLTRTDTDGSSHILFIVRDDDGGSDILFKTSDATWQAYNNYGGTSLYVGGASGPPELNHASKVSYNRPFYTRAGGGGGGAMEDWVFNAEYPMIRWIERNGYDVSYTTDLDMDRDPKGITPDGTGDTYSHKILLSVGHDEYWSAAERTKFEDARDAGVHLAFFSGNEVYWKTRWEESIDGTSTPHRTLVCYKEGTLGENVCGYKCDGSTTTWTGLWRDGDPGTYPGSDGGKPENALTGQISWDGTTQSIVVPYEYKDLRLWRNTSVAGLTSGVVTFPYGTLGYEWDWEQYHDHYPSGRITLSKSTYGGHTHKLSLYRHTSGALVFGAGTCQWSWGLDSEHDRGDLPPSPDMQQATLNLFADMGVQPGTKQSDLTAATASTDETPPLSVIDTPLDGASFPANNPVTISGTASDAGGVVAGVDISVDGGATWKPATGSTSWTYTWTPLTEGPVTILTHAFDDSGNIEASGTVPSSNAIGVTVTEAVAPVCPCTIWDPATVPVNITEPDATPFELGVKFRAKEDGYITGVRFYKSPSNTGTHIGNLWSATKTNLASAIFINETASGWQEVTFGAPVPVFAGTTYVASYHTSAGYYSEDDNYFTTSLETYYLEALADDEDGPNGVYASSTGSVFPENGYMASNYYVDVVFMTEVGPDVTPPAVVSVAPVSGASGVAITTNPKAYFNEALEPSTVSASTVSMTGPGATPVAGSVSYANGIITVVPDAPLDYSTTYTLTLKGGYEPRIEDLAGNGLSSDHTWSFTTSSPPPPPPDEGPGGPILVISGASNPFSRYPVEILRAQGFNEFYAMDISEVTTEVINLYDVVILGEIPLSTTEVTMLSEWADAGGLLIALRPDAQLAGLLGITPAGGTLSDQYLLVNTGSEPGAGIVDETIQFHSEADLYTLDGATSLATLYSDATTPTTYPAVTEKAVGSNGGKAYAFTYDLARSIVYTRQGNPLWANQKRDGEIMPIRSDDLFYGAASFDPQPDWIDLDKVAIPQADEQQHLLSNIITLGIMHKKPLPRFWFLPKGLKAAVVMTGDNHGDAGMQPRFDIDIAASPAGCSVDDWECVRSTGYLYVGSTFTDAQASYYNDLGFEVALHVNTGCDVYTETQFNNFIDAQMAVFNAAFPSIPLPETNRNHCIAWSGYAMPAEVEAANNIRLDVNYYYWPNNWTLNRPGMFTGSGQPMRFANTEGTIIDCYQVATQMQDETQFPNSTPYPSFCDDLLDKAIGPEGYYGVFATNMHFDYPNHAGANAIVASAQARGIPVVSAKQMLDWLDGRNGSSFTTISWNTNALNFTVNVGEGALNLRGMVPVLSDIGMLIGLTQDGSPLSYTTETVKGIEYAFFSATDGDYIAAYGTDDLGPVITEVIAAPNPDGTVKITWTTDEFADSKVDYGTNEASLTSSVSDAALVTGHEVTLNGLDLNTIYYFQVTSVDAFDNSTTEPATPAEFTTGNGNCAEDFTDANFNLGTPDANTFLVFEDGGGVILKPTLNEEFSGTTIPAGWSSGDFNPGGTTFGGGQVTVNGTHLYSNASFVPGSSIEFEATYNSATFQNVGFSFDQPFNNAPWITIGQGNIADGNLYARASDGSSISLGSGLLGSPHKYRIQWNAVNFEFYLDDNPVPAATIPLEVTTNLYLQISDVQSSDGTLSVNWLRVAPYETSGSYTSRIFDRGSPSGWGEVSWNSTEPAGTSIDVFVRTGDTPTPDGSWTDFVQANQGTSIGGSSQYLQYRADLATTDVSVTPVLEDLAVKCEPDPDETPPLISGIVATPGADGTSATIAWSTDELASSLVEYGTDENNLSLSVSDASLVLTHSTILTGLTAETLYFYRVTSEDAASNSTTEPTPPDAPLSFTTLAPPCFEDNAAEDFAAGTFTGTYLALDEEALILQPAAASEFSVLPPASEWTSYAWNTGGTSTVSDGVLYVEGARFNTEPEGAGFGPGSVMEFRATFGASANHHIGFGGGTNAIESGGIYMGQSPWAMFSTWTTGTAVYARTYDGGTFVDYNFGGTGLIGTAHLYRIEWNTGSVDFYVDGNLVHSQAVTIAGPMRPAFSDYDINGVMLQVDWIRTTPYFTPGTFESRIFNAGTPRLWGTASWTAEVPSGSTLALSQRQSNSGLLILEEPWTLISSNGATVGGTSQYIQYRAELATTDTKVTPVLHSFSVACTEPGTTAPVITLNPASQEVCEGESATFMSDATGYPVPSVQWQESPDGSTWTDIDGATAGTLEFITIAADEGMHYQAIWTNSEGSATSTPAILSVDPLSAATVTAVNPSVCSGEEIQLQLTAASGEAPWDLEVNGITYTGINLNDIFATFPTDEYTLWQPSDVPANPAVTDNKPIEVGVKFSTTVPGFIQGIRFYKGANNTGTHIGTLWTASGTSLASATFVDETASGWQEVRFDDPVYIQANTTYVASYWSPIGYFAFDAGGLTTAVTNYHLTALAAGTDGPNGVYQYDAAGFPTNGNNANYWVDVIFEEELPGTFLLSSVTDAKNCTNSEESLIEVTINPAPGGTLTGPSSECANSPIYLTFQETSGSGPYSLVINGVDHTGVLSEVPFYSGIDASPESVTNIWIINGGPDGLDGGAYELGVKFRSSIAGQVKGIRFYKHSLNTGVHTGTLWSGDGTELETATFTDETSQGWQEVLFSNPVTIEPNITYVASYWAPNGHYAFTDNYFTSQSFSNGPLTALQSGIDGLNGIYNIGSHGFPTGSYNNSNYWVDVVFSSATSSYNFTLTDISDNNGCNTTGITGNTISVSVAKCGEFQTYLQAAYNSTNDNMDVGLLGNIPLSQPYNADPWLYDGTETVSAMDPSVVDWVLVELRSDAETPFERKVALLLEDGKIVHYNNTTQGVHFENTAEGVPYYVVVYHRNHMPVMSANPMFLETDPVPFSFADLANCYGNGAIQLEETPPVYGMIAGDVNGNGWLTYSGPGNDRGPILARIVEEENTTNINAVTSGYFAEDILMDFEVKYIGTGNDRAIIPANLKLLTGSELLNAAYQSAVPMVTTKDGIQNNGPLHIFLDETGDDLLVKITTDKDILNSAADNVQFTLAWETSHDEPVRMLLTQLQSDFGLLPQGTAQEHMGWMYLTFVSVVPVELTGPFLAGDEVTLAAFGKVIPGDPATFIKIVDDAYTRSTNGMYYISLLGRDHTGTILANTLGGKEFRESGISIYPNPVSSGLVYVGLNLLQEEEVTVTVMDIHGSVVMMKILQVNAGVSRSQIDLGNRSRGVYYIMVRGDDLNVVQKLIIQ